MTKIWHEESEFGDLPWPYPERKPSDLALSAMLTVRAYLLRSIKDEQEVDWFWDEFISGPSREHREIGPLKNSLRDWAKDEDTMLLGVGVLAASCAYNALRFEEDGNLSLAWPYAADAMWWAGMVNLVAYPDDGENDPVTDVMRKLAFRRHAENRAMRQDAEDWYKRRIKAGFISKDAAAEAIAGKVVPAKWRTVRDWLSKVK